MIPLKHNLSVKIEELQNANNDREVLKRRIDVFEKELNLIIEKERL